MVKSKKAIFTAIFFVALAVFVVYEVMSVLSTGSSQRYKDVPPPHMMQKAEQSGEGEPPLAEVKQEKAQQADETVAEKAETATDDMADKAADAASDTKQAVSEAASDATQAASEAASDAKQAASDVASDAEQAASDAASDVKQTATDAMNTVEDKASQAADTVKQKVESATSTAPAAAASQSAAAPQVHVVKAEGLSYSPMVVEINPGDTVAWENMSSHDTQALKGLIPDDSEYWHSDLSQNYQRTFTKPGIYVYKCTPHFGAGMGGVIIVGKPVNLDAIKAADVKGAAKRLVKKAIAAAEKM